MPYGESIDDDLIRAKEILQNGKLTDDDLEVVPEEIRASLSESLAGLRVADMAAAYHILKSFVIEIERLQTELALKEEACKAQFGMLEEIRKMADAAMGIPERVVKNDPRPSGAKAATRMLVTQLEEVRVRLTETQRARIGDTETIGRLMCEVDTLTLQIKTLQSDARVYESTLREAQDDV